MNKGERGEAPRTPKPGVPIEKEVSSDNQSAEFCTPFLLSPTLDDYEIEYIVTDTFDRSTWQVMEACLSVHASLLIDGAECLGLMIVGPSGSGKTTAIRVLESAPQVYRADEATTASFVSSNPALTEEELREIDLLPKITHKALLGREMSTWFSGSTDEVRNKMSTIATLMDGDGLRVLTGAHGERGYTGDHRFNFIGASTPLSPRAWRVMGHTGNRFLFHEKQDRKSAEEVKGDVFEGDEYGKKVELVQSCVSPYLNELWDKTGGYASIEWGESPAEQIQDAIFSLAKLVSHARAPVVDDAPIIEGRHRITKSLYNIARGRALLGGRLSVTRADLPVVARVALSTMHRKRRPLVRHLINPETDDTLTTPEVEACLGVSTKTAQRRMELLDTLDIGNFEEGSGSKPYSVTLSNNFQWPTIVPFPEI